MKKGYLILTCLLSISLISQCYATNPTLKMHFDFNEYEKIEIFSSSFDLDYRYTVNKVNELKYIIHYLNSFELNDDGKITQGGDLPTLNLNLFGKNGKETKIGFFYGRFYDSNEKEYEINKDEYYQFINFLYALKTKQLILGDEISFEPSAWAKEDITTAIEKGILLYENQIDYTGYITRNEFCQLVYNSLISLNVINNDESLFNPFDDAKMNNVVAVLYNYKIIKGKSEKEFYPYDRITREEASVILNNMFELIHKSKLDYIKQLSFYDKDEVSFWALDSVSKMVSLNILIGDPFNFFRPKDNITKEESVVAILRLLDLNY